MSDLDTQDVPVEEAEDNRGPLARALAEHMPLDSVVYPETDPMRAAMSGMRPAGNADTVPPAAEALHEAVVEEVRARLPQRGPREEAEGEIESARDFRWDVSNAELTPGTVEEDEDLR